MDTNPKAARAERMGARHRREGRPFDPVRFVDHVVQAAYRAGFDSAEQASVDRRPRAWSTSGEAIGTDEEAFCAALDW